MSELVKVSREDLLNYYTYYWNDGPNKGTLPKLWDVANHFSANPVAIQNLVEDDSFRRTLALRGLPLDKKSLLDPTQFKCIAILTDPSIRGGLSQRLKVAGVSYQRYRAWMQIPEFKSAVTSAAEQILENNLSSVNLGLVGAAERGDVAAIKFYYELTGKYNPNDRAVMDVMDVLAKVVEILCVEVTDPEVLQRIATKLQMLGTAAGVPGNVKVVKGEAIDFNVPLGEIE